MGNEDSVIELDESKKDSGEEQPQMASACDQTIDSVSKISARPAQPQLQGYSIHNIESWFRRMESYFSIVGFSSISNSKRRDQAKFDHIVICMDEKLFEQAYEVINNPP